MDHRSIARTSDLEYLRAVATALSSIAWQHQYRVDPLPHQVVEYRGTGHGAPAYRVVDVKTDPGRDWWPVALVTTTGTVHAPGQTDVELAARQSTLPAREVGEMVDRYLERPVESAPSGTICKRCGEPSPVGVGYTDTTPGAAQESEQVTTCPCGHSRAPGSDQPVAEQPQIDL